VVFEPLFVGANQLLPVAEQDWAAKMLGPDMMRQLQRSAATGMTSATTNMNPVMPYIYGQTFGDTLTSQGEY
jgi:hypothetical protein